MTIRYWYYAIGGDQAAETFTRDYRTGDSFKVRSPEITGFTVDRSWVEGVMKNSDLEFDVIYHDQEYKLVIYYVDTHGNEVATHYEDILKPGEHYNVISPDVPGMVPNKKIVDGDMPARNVTITVVYTRPGEFIVIDDYGVALGIPVDLNIGECYE